MRHMNNSARPSRGGDGRAQERATGEVAHLHSHDINHLSPPQYHSASTDGPGLDEALLAHALAYAARGWPVLPCRPRGKEPLVAGGYQAATTDPATIRGWWTRWPGANIGIPTGRASGLVVLDIDPRNGGDAALLALPPLPETVEVLTGGGGRHVYFRAPDREIRCRPNALGPGVDIKADGGYVLVPPSIHPTGRRYCWETSSHPDEVPIAPLPEWLVERLAEPEAAPATRAGGGRIPEGQRNVTLASLAGSMRRRGMTREAIEAALLAENAARCDPPLPEGEVRQIARSVSRYAPEPTLAEKAPGGATEERPLPYIETPGGLVWLRPTRHGTVPVPLTNFTARIVGDVVRDDGSGELERSFEIEATLVGARRRFAVPAAQFQSLGWVAEHLGAGAVIQPGQSLRDHARAAIQLLSGSVPERRVFTHLGWRHIGEEWVYLHAGGAIGAAGPVCGIEVAVEPSLGGFVLPDPPEGDELARAIWASLRIVDTTSHVGYILLAAIYRAALRPCDFALHLTGPTGVGKTELAAIAQQHWGAGMDARHLPANWSSTPNSLEALAFLAKDALLVVDDFAPHGGAADVQRLHAAADRLLRAQGNAAGRMRLRSDATLRPPRPPRGMILSTGEDVPRGQSLRARILVVEIEPGDVNWEVLSACQEEAAAGRYAAALSAFIRWVAGRYDRIQAAYREEVAALRAQAHRSGQHRRTPGIVADLAFGMRAFLDFGREAGAFRDKLVEIMADETWKALGEVARAQETYLAAADPARRFLELLAAAIASGAAHVAAPDGGAPAVDRAAWGWRRVDHPHGERWEPMGMRVGWVEEGDLFLDPDAAYAAAQRLGEPIGDRLAVSPRTLRKRLAEAGLLATTGKASEARETLLVRRFLQGRRRSVLHLRTDALTGPSTPDQGGGAAACGQVFRARGQVVVRSESGT